MEANQTQELNCFHFCLYITLACFYEETQSELRRLQQREKSNCHKICTKKTWTSLEILQDLEVTLHRLNEIPAEHRRWKSTNIIRFLNLHPTTRRFQNGAILDPVFEEVNPEDHVLKLDCVLPVWAGRSP